MVMEWLNYVSVLLFWLSWYSVQFLLLRVNGLFGCWVRYVLIIDMLCFMCRFVLMSLQLQLLRWFFGIGCKLRVRLMCVVFCLVIVSDISLCVMWFCKFLLSVVVLVVSVLRYCVQRLGVLGVLLLLVIVWFLLVYYVLLVWLKVNVFLSCMVCDLCDCIQVVYLLVLEWLQNRYLLMILIKYGCFLIGVLLSELIRWNDLLSLLWLIIGLSIQCVVV